MPHGGRTQGVPEHDEGEDKKVYYGFGVFMGLSLADLRAMKADFIEPNAQDRIGTSLLTNDVTNGSGHSLGGRGGSLIAPSQPSREIYVDYDVEKQGSMEQSYVVNGRPSLPDTGYPRPHEVSHHHRREHEHFYGEGRERGEMNRHPSVSSTASAHPSDYEEHASDMSDHSDGSYSKRKSHSLNYILH